MEKTWRTNVVFSATRQTPRSAAKKRTPAPNTLIEAEPKQTTMVAKYECRTNIANIVTCSLKDHSKSRVSRRGASLSPHSIVSCNAPEQAVHSPVEVNKLWYTGNSCASITAVSGEDEYPDADDDVSWVSRKKVCGMMAQVC